jgi:rhodanese-related sulfurtransferase
MAPVNHIDIAQLEQLRQDGPVVMLDVRTDPEVARGIIAGARHIALNLLPARYTELDPDALTVIYCGSGARSAQACAWLAEKGFARVHNLQGGIMAWARSGLPLTPPG